MNINTIRNNINQSIALPGSKSITLRNLVLASLAEGTTEIDAPCDCDDTRELVDCLGELGIAIEASDDYRRVTVEGRGGRFAGGPVGLDLGLSGTSARFLIALSVLRTDETRLAGRGSLNERPNSPLLDAVEQMGGATESANGGCLPVTIRGPGTFNRSVRMKGDVSSQFFSALLQVAPVLPDGLQIHVEGDLVSKPYIDITLNEMRKFGVQVENDNYRKFVVAPQRYRSGPPVGGRRCFRRLLFRGTRLDSRWEGGFREPRIRNPARGYPLHVRLRKSGRPCSNGRENDGH